MQQAMQTFLRGSLEVVVCFEKMPPVFVALRTQNPTMQRGYYPPSGTRPRKINPSTIILCVHLGILCGYFLPFSNFVLYKARKWTILGKRKKRSSLWPTLTKKSSLRALFWEECLEGKAALHQSKQLASISWQHQSWHTSH